MNKFNKVEQARKFLTVNPNIRVADLSKRLGVTKPYAYTLVAKAKKLLANEHARGEPPQLSEVIHALAEGRVKVRMQGNRPENWETVAVTSNGQSILAGGPTEEELNADSVNHPPHYKVGGIETIDFIEAKGLGYHLGNVIKYVTRADHKDNKLEDLRKAQWYLTRAIERVKG